MNGPEWISFKDFLGSSALTQGERQIIEKWLDLVDEQDDEMREDVLAKCESDPAARVYFLGRATFEVPEFERRRAAHIASDMPPDEATAAARRDVLFY
ncbi:MAG: hypothetical protein Q8O25_08305 [Sulfurisoma sp.]|nr:hypothetical protein [Sulfurisoma sp.]